MTDGVAIKRRQETTNRLLVAVLILLLIAGAYQFAYINPQAAQTRSALCALRSDLVSRVSQTQHFLAHPQSFPEFNDPKTLALIKSQVQGQQRTVAALSGLSCS